MDLVDFQRSDPEKKILIAGIGPDSLRRDILGLVGSGRIVSPFSLAKPDLIVVRKASASEPFAERLAHYVRRPLFQIEDGFIKGFASNLNEPPYSYCVNQDWTWALDANQRIGENMLLPSVEKMEHTATLIGLIRDHRLSKYNNAAVVGRNAAGIPSHKSFILVADERLKKLAFRTSENDFHQLHRMLSFALEIANGRSIVITSDSDLCEIGPVARLAKLMGIDVIFTPKMNSWPLIEEADAVLTLSSQIGFEALLAGKPVHCFKGSNYSQRGLTVDHFVKDNAPKSQSIEQVFYANYCQRAHYLDLHSRKKCSLETSIEQALYTRDQRMRLGKSVITSGFSPWKRLATRALLIGADGKARHRGHIGSAQKVAKAVDGRLAVWGAKLDGADTFLKIEDGFIRSRGLGVKLVYPCSLTIDFQRPHYDSRGSSDLEEILCNTVFNANLKRRAEQLRHTLIEMDITKYNLKQTPNFPDVATNSLRILVPGQVVGDQSILFGAQEVTNNHQLVKRVRALYPKSFIVYKSHPDVAGGHRSGGPEPIDQDVTVSDGSITQWLDWADRVETITSLTGFEALVRGKPVGVHGAPFYAGWGLTDDRTTILRRQRKLTIDELIAGALILYPFYVHPISRLPCPIEIYIHSLAAF
jgi:capsular polysaccharide export protein